ncbi:SDR family oxidoreductase [Legionella sp. CNM-1927-20]|uniref:SDR family oxidoreductase n=1 Tax=Legionella sp. CNM-1927-20 TaxID=3422221 RepID=UPI00403ABDF9
MSKVAFITGAAGGIGQAITENFIKHGYFVALVDQQREQLIRLTHELNKKYQLKPEKQLRTFNIDITDSTQVKATVNKILSQHNKIDILFNGAGIARIGGIDMSPQSFEEIIRVNLFGTFNCIHEIAPIMKKQSSGYIFNVASRQGKMGGANLAGYASSKFGVVGLSESILKELIDTGVKVTALCPSYTNTSMMDLLDFPREEMLSPEDIVKTVNYLLSLSTPACVKEVLIEVRKLVKQPF